MLSACRTLRNSFLLLGATLCGLITGCSTKSTPIVVTVSGPSTVTVGNTAQFRASISNLSNQSVTWGVSGNPPGNIDSTGLYSPPASLPVTSAATVNIVATSVTSPGYVSKPYPVNLLNPVPFIGYVTPTQSSNPLTYNLGISGSGFATACTVTIAGSPIPCGTGYVNTSLIEITNYSVPTPSTSTLSVVVTNPNPGMANSNTFTVSLPITVEVTPPSPQAVIGSPTPVNFTATIYGTASTNVCWSVPSGASYGTITSSCSPSAGYTAPKLGMPAVGLSATVLASLSDGTTRAPGTASSSVNLVNPVPTITSAVTSSAVPTLTGTNVTFPITITGTNFVSSANPMPENSTVTSSAGAISITGVTVAPPSQIIANITVPSGTAAVPITVTNPTPGGNSATTTLTLPPTVTISPAVANPPPVVGSATPTTFSAIVTGTAVASSVVWSVGGAANGTLSPASAIGPTISYVAPYAVPAKLSVTLTATSSFAKLPGTATINLLLPPVPANCSYPVNPIVATDGTYFSETPTCTSGGPTTGFTISPTPPSTTSLPSPLMFMATTGAIYGSPSTVQLTPLPYTVTPINQGGSGAPISEQLQLLPMPPSGCSYPALFKPVGALFTKTTSITCTGGGAPTSFSADISSPLPPYLIVDPLSGVISGPFMSYIPPATYYIDVSNAGGPAVSPASPVPVLIGAVTQATLKPGQTFWGADGHIGSVAIYWYDALPVPQFAVGLGPSMTPGGHSQIDDLEAIFGTNPNSIFYRVFEDITNCNDDYYSYTYLRGAGTCDPTNQAQLGYKPQLDQLQKTGIIMPIAALITYPLPTYDSTGKIANIGDAGCTVGSTDITNVPNKNSSELDMYSWAYCTAARNVNYAPETMYWYIGNEWNGQIPNVVTPGLAFPTDESSAAQWRAEKYYPLFRGALAGAIAAIRDLAPYATIISGATGGPAVGLAVAFGEDLKNYTYVDPAGRNLLWDVTNLHWGNDVESIMKSEDNGLGPLVAYAFPDYTAANSTYIPPGTNMYQALNAVGKSPSGTIPPVFVDEFGSGDGNYTDTTLQPLTGPATTAQMLNFLANSPASSGAPGVVGGNFYELYPSCGTPTPSAPNVPGCGASADTTQFLYCYGDVCGDGNSGALSQAGLAVQAWIAQHGNPSTNSTAQFTLPAASSFPTINQGGTASTSITVAALPGTNFQGSVTLSCNVFSFPTAGMTYTPGCNFKGQQTVALNVGQSTLLMIPTFSSTSSTPTPVGAYVIFVTASFSGNPPTSAPASADIHLSLQVNP